MTKQQANETPVCLSSNNGRYWAWIQPAESCLSEQRGVPRVCATFPARKGPSYPNVVFVCARMSCGAGRCVAPDLLLASRQGVITAEMESYCTNRVVTLIQLTLRPATL